jgi:hypothetical protein
MPDLFFSMKQSKSIRSNKMLATPAELNKRKLSFTNQLSDRENICTDVCCCALDTEKTRPVDRHDRRDNFLESILKGHVNLPETLAGSLSVVSPQHRHCEPVGNRTASLGNTQHGVGAPEGSCTTTIAYWMLRWGLFSFRVSRSFGGLENVDP